MSPTFRVTEGPAVKEINAPIGRVVTFADGSGAVESWCTYRPEELRAQGVPESDWPANAGE
jgi:hypothetical protein